MERLGRSARSRGVVYITGGSTALLLGFRQQTIDIDLKLDPEPSGAFEAIAQLKIDLDLNIELAAPDHFIPQLPGWRERSPLIALYGEVEFRHYDFYAQALSKIERGHETDLKDVRALIDNNHIEVTQLVTYFSSIRADLIRFPAIDASDFEARLNAFLKTVQDAKKN